MGQTATHEPHVWTPIDHFNPQYMETIAARQQRVNFIKENKVPLYRLNWVIILNAKKIVLSLLDYLELKKFIRHKIIFFNCELNLERWWLTTEKLFLFNGLDVG